MNDWGLLELELQKTVQLHAPYLVFNGDIDDESLSKTGRGIVDWCPGRVAGQMRLPGGTIDIGVPYLSVAEAVEKGVRSFIIGITPIGGQLSEDWFPVVVEAIEAGFDIVSGLHSRLTDIPEFVAAASRSGARLIDIRVPPRGIPVGTGKKRSGKRVLMVGTDCAVGKKYSALALTRALTGMGIKATFRATGQTGIMIAGRGIAVDAVVADFISGAAELLSPANDDDHWDVIEGQGSLFNPGYAAVSLGLMHGSQPDALVVCHEATLTKILGWPDYSIPSLDECMETNLRMARLTNPDVRIAGLSINTSKLAEDQRGQFLDDLSKRTGLPCSDPMVDGSQAIAENIRDI